MTTNDVGLDVIKMTSFRLSGGGSRLVPSGFGAHEAKFLTMTIGRPINGNDEMLILAFVLMAVSVDMRSRCDIAKSSSAGVKRWD